LADYRARGIEAISTGAIVIRKRSGKNWARFDELAVAPRGDAGAHLERVFAAQDLLHIIVLERGRLVESGTHDELMARQGLYFYLASQQLEL